jgi:group I intron endonuclease
MSNNITKIDTTYSVQKTKICFKKFIKYNPLNYEGYLLTLNIKRRKEFEQRISFEKIWDNFEQDKFYTQEGSLRKQCGVYCIMNLVDRKKYFGESCHIYRRLTNHIQELNNNSHCNDKLQNSWNKYGEENFIYFVVEYCKRDDLKHIECKYIESFGDLNPTLLFNLTKNSLTKFTHSEENKTKLSQSKSNKIYLLKLADNNIVKVSTLKKYCKDNKLPYSILIKTDLENNYKRYFYDIKFSYILKSYDKDEVNVPDVSDIDSMNRLEYDRNIIAESLNVSSNTITSLIVDNFGNLHTTLNITKFCENNGIDATILSRTFNSKLTSENYQYNGFKIINKFRGIFSFDENKFREDNFNLINSYINNINSVVENKKIYIRNTGTIFTIFNNVTKEYSDTENLIDFCVKNKLKYSSLRRTYMYEDFYHRGFKIIKKILSHRKIKIQSNKNND